MTDKQLLQDAARAAGIDIWRFHDCGKPVIKVDGVPVYWSPLTDDGDALRLAVRLGLVLNLSPREDCRGQTVVTYHGVCKIEEPCYEGRDVAARLAIVRAAAAIGRWK